MIGTLDKGTIYKGTLNKKTLYKDSLLKGISDGGGGGGVEFKTSIYAIDGAYIRTLENEFRYGYYIDISFYASSGIENGRTIFASQSNGGTGYKRIFKDTVSYVAKLKVGTSYEDTEVGTILSNSDNIFDDINMSRNTSYNLLYYQIFSSSPSNDKIKIHYIRIKDSSKTLLAELKPAIVNGESGMYDTVTQTFYGNANSVGSLVCE